MVNDGVWEAVSYTMGTSSVLIWLCAQMPQILKNWRRKSVEGLSPGFLTAWVLGDASNLAGCLLTGQLGVQILLASYYCAVDAVLITQFLLYRPRSIFIDACDPETSGDSLLNPNDNTNHPPKPRSKSVLVRARDTISMAVGLGGLVRSASAAPTGLEETLVQEMSAPAAEPATNSSLSRAASLLSCVWPRDIGFAVAYFSMCMYLMSRLPQILHNFQRKSTTGVSMLLFISALMGNLTYTLSILLAPQSMGSHSDRGAFLLHELPYLIGAAGTILFDFIILGQWYWYQRVTAHRRRSTQPYDRISRPYLGLPSDPPSRAATPALVSSAARQQRSIMHFQPPSVRTTPKGPAYPNTPLMASTHPLYRASVDESAVEDDFV